MQLLKLKLKICIKYNEWDIVIKTQYTFILIINPHRKIHMYTTVYHLFNYQSHYNAPISWFWGAKSQFSGYFGRNHLHLCIYLYEKPVVVSIDLNMFRKTYYIILFLLVVSLIMVVSIFLSLVWYSEWLACGGANFEFCNSTNFVIFCIYSASVCYVTSPHLEVK